MHQSIKQTNQQEACTQPTATSRPGPLSSIPCHIKNQKPAISTIIQRVNWCSVHLSKSRSVPVIYIFIMRSYTRYTQYITHWITNQL